MDLETIDDSQQTLPGEAIKEIKLMCKWMTFTGVILIIFVILSVLGNLGNYANTGEPVFLFSIFLNGLSLYLGFMVLKTSNHFDSYAENHDDAMLAQALKLNKLYWTISTLMLIVSFIISFASR
jgi:hypothetical protein